MVLPVKNLIFMQEWEIMVEETGDKQIYTKLMLAEEFGVLSDQTMVPREGLDLFGEWGNYGETEVTEYIFELIVSFCGVHSWQSRRV